MSYHKTEWYEEAVADFEVCHKVESDAGYDILLQRSKEKLHERSKKFHTMVIDEVNGSSEVLAHSKLSKRINSKFRQASSQT